MGRTTHALSFATVATICLALGGAAKTVSAGPAFKAGDAFHTTFEPLVLVTTRSDELTSEAQSAPTPFSIEDLTANGANSEIFSIDDAERDQIELDQMFANIQGSAGTFDVRRDQTQLELLTGRRENPQQLGVRAILRSLVDTSQVQNIAGGQDQEDSSPASALLDEIVTAALGDDQFDVFTTAFSPEIETTGLVEFTLDAVGNFALLVSETFGGINIVDPQTGDAIEVYESRAENPTYSNTVRPDHGGAHAGVSNGRPKTQVSRLVFQVRRFIVNLLTDPLFIAFLVGSIFFWVILRMRGRFQA